MTDLPRDQDTLWLRASKSGNGVGLTVLTSTESDSVLLIHVLPKLWRLRRSPQVVLTPDSGGTIHAYEGDYVGFSPRWRSLAGRHLAPAEWSPDNSPPSGSNDSQTRDGVGDALWSRDSPSVSTTSSTSSVPSSHVTAMWSMLLGTGQTPTLVPGTVLPSPTGAKVLAAVPQLADLVKATFVSAAASAIPRRRPLYRTILERSESVRGRIVPQDLLTRAMRHEASVTCEFDELSGDHQLWRIVRSALATCLSAPGQTESVMGGLAQLHDVGTLSAIQALREGQRLVGSVRSRQLQDLLGLALDVLSSDFGIATGATPGTGVVANIKFVTSSLWETLLERAFKKSGCSVSRQEGLDVVYGPPRPRGSHGHDAEWSPRPLKRPDLMVTAPSGVRFIVDAKYSETRSFDQADKSDQYQAITYAHRSGLPTLLAFARSDRDQLGETFDHVTLRATPPSDWTGARHAQRPDATWRFFGSMTFDFPGSSDSTHWVDAVSTMSAKARLIVSELTQTLPTRTSAVETSRRDSSMLRQQ